MIPSGLPLWGTIIAVAFTGGFMTALLNRLWDWLSSRNGKRDQRLATVVEKAIASSPTIRDINRKLDNDHEHFTKLDAMFLASLRNSLFRHPYDQNSHLNAIRNGEQYVRLGGNGTGHVRLKQLQADYARRVQDDDWDYNHDRP